MLKASTYSSIAFALCALFLFVYESSLAIEVSVNPISIKVDASTDVDKIMNGASVEVQNIKRYFGIETLVTMAGFPELAGTTAVLEVVDPEGIVMVKAPLNIYNSERIRFLLAPELLEKAKLIISIHREGNDREGDYLVLIVEVYSFGIESGEEEGGWGTRKTTKGHFFKSKD